MLKLVIGDATIKAIKVSKLWVVVLLHSWMAPLDEEPLIGWRH